MISEPDSAVVSVIFPSSLYPFLPILSSLLPFHLLFFFKLPLSVYVPIWSSQLKSLPLKLDFNVGVLFSEGSKNRHTVILPVVPSYRQGTEPSGQNHSSSKLTSNHALTCLSSHSENASGGGSH